MPVYVYKALAGKSDCICSDMFEKVQSMSEPPLTNCPQCGAPVQRIIQPVGLVKGKKGMLSDKNIKKHGFTKLVNEGDGKFRKI